MSLGVWIPLEGIESPEELDKVLKKVRRTHKKAIALGPGTGNLKRLPRIEGTDNIARTFMARGNKYTILSGSEGIGIHRATILNQAISQLGFARQFDAVWHYIEAGLKIMNGPGDLGSIRTKTNQHFLPLLKAIGDHSREQYDIAFWVCTLFIIRDGEDLTKWVEEEQKAKIEDWAAEYSEIDFFQLAGSSDKGFFKTYQKVRLAKETEEQSLKVVNGVTT